MKKYNFSKYELWFSFRALQMLACAERNCFKRFVKKTWRAVLSDNVNNIEWNQDKVYLSRREGIRNISRMTEIFDLDTSYAIMNDYRKNLPRNYQNILARMKELKAQNKEEYSQGLREELRKQGMLNDFLDNSVSSNNELLTVLSSFDLRKKERQRIVLDYRNGSFKLVMVNSFRTGRRSDTKRKIGRGLTAR